ncbi:MAG: cyclic nucleotide-binding domain-containing protein [Candidatus Nitrohelix vancouverensis]|uniref:Cyclic nucleotide-binding domain-containing protein n=1 Tax=Candidatus Nitrohelix vancouverensis TaxID=2705534 RepID=A0A7T0G2C7_9BACT|nr:MAG: cyclic nucleotide-binding domain-containing protein [Candidatus Nitrohelix vancouverensis]
MEFQLILSFIASLPFFKDFTGKEREALIQTQDLFLKFRADQLIIREGEIDDGLFIILKGVVQITKRNRPNKVLAQLRPGALFGEVTLISKRARTTNATAQGDVVVMKITQEMIEKLSVELQKKFHQQLVLQLVQRLEEMNEKLSQARND